MEKMPLTVITGLIFLSSCVGAGVNIQPLGQDVALPRDTLQSAKMSVSVLEKMSAQIAQRNKHKLHSLLIVRQGKLVFEQYYNGYTRDTPHDIRSATKSITSLLTGIAIERGFLANVDTPIMSHLASAYPQVQDKGEVTIRHLLTMSAGLDCDDHDRSTRGQEDRMYRSQDWVHYFLSLPQVSPPGQKSRYCTGGVVALGETIARASGQDFEAFAHQALFEPLGITNYRWARFDDGNKVDTGGHLLITPQGLAKIGWLVLQEGRWGNQPIVPAEWIRLSTRHHARCDRQPYGFLWWMNLLPNGEKLVKVLMARGNGGQAIFIVPDLQLVAVTTAGYYNSEKSRIPYDLFFGSILPAAAPLGSSSLQATEAAELSDAAAPTQGPVQ